MFVINFYHSDKDFNQQGKNLYVILSQSVSFIIVKKQLHPVKSQTNKEIQRDCAPPPFRQDVDRKMLISAIKYKVDEN